MKTGHVAVAPMKPGRDQLVRYFKHLWLETCIRYCR